MYAFISVLIIIVCILLILIVLVQNSKGGGLASNFSAANQIMGARRSADFLEKATWTLASALLVLSIAATIVIPREKKVNRSLIQDQIENTTDYGQPGNFPTEVPQEDQQNTQPQE